MWKHNSMVVLAGDRCGRAQGGLHRRISGGQSFRLLVEKFPRADDGFRLEGRGDIRDLALAREAGHLLLHKSEHLRNEMSMRGLPAALFSRAWDDGLKAEPGTRRRAFVSWKTTRLIPHLIVDVSQLVLDI